MTQAAPDPSEPGNSDSATQTQYAHYPPPMPVPVSRDQRSRGRQFVLGGIILVALAALGIPLGLLWQALAPRVELVATETGFRYTTESPEGYVGDDGVFTFLGLGLGVVVALIVWLVLRRSRGPIQVSALVLGSVACQVVAWRFGELFGRQGWESTLESAKAGDHLFRPPKLLLVNIDFGKAWDALVHFNIGGFFDNLQLGAVATMALAAVFMYTILAGWSRYQTLNRDSEPVLPTMQTTAPDAGSPQAGRLPS